MKLFANMLLMLSGLAALVLSNSMAQAKQTTSPTTTPKVWTKEMYDEHLRIFHGPDKHVPAPRAPATPSPHGPKGVAKATTPKCRDSQGAPKTKQPCDDSEAPTPLPTASPASPPSTTQPSSIDSKEDFLSVHEVDLVACRCGESSTCNESPVELASHIHLCFSIAHTSPTFIESLETLNLQQPGFDLHEIFKDGNPLLAGAMFGCSADGSNCIASLPIDSEFFEHDRPSALKIDGDMTLYPMDLQDGGPVGFAGGGFKIHFTVDLTLDKLEEGPARSSSNNSQGSEVDKIERYYIAFGVVAVAVAGALVVSALTRPVNRDPDPCDDSN